MRRFTVLCPLFACILHHAPAQQEIPRDMPHDSLGIIDTVIVGGNQKTESYVILNEMTLTAGMQATSATMEFDRSRIYNLGLFTKVDVSYDSLGTTHFLFVDVRERWYLIPFPLLGFRDGDPKRFYFGAGVLHNNVRGRNQKLYASFTLGYNPSASLAFVDPMFDREERLYLSTALSYNSVRNRSEREAALSGEFNEYHFNASVGLGKRWSLYQTAGVTLGYNIVRITETRPGRTVDPGGTDSFPYAIINAVYDSRDLGEYATRGTFASGSVTNNGLGLTPVDFWRFAADLRRYVLLLPELTLAFRIHASVVAGGKVPTYARSYFGYGERIRGYYTTIFEGEDIAGGSAELRYMLITPRVISFQGLPIPEEFTVWRFGVCLALFGDTGATWFRGDPVAWNSFSSGTGGGVHFLLPYGVVARIEYAWNDLGRGQFILALRSAL